MSKPFNRDRVPGFKRTLFHFKVLHEGWEMDNDAWVVELKDGSRTLVSTSHGGTYVTQADFFEDKVAEYRSVLAATEQALAMATKP